MIAWTYVHLKAPTQVTCAHCQRSLSPELQALGFRSTPATFRPGEPHILHHFSFPSTPQFVFLSNQTANPTTTKSSTSSTTFRRLPASTSASAKGRESYRQFVFRQPLPAIFFLSPNRPTRTQQNNPLRSLDPSLASDFRPQRRGANHTCGHRQWEEFS